MYGAGIPVLLFPILAVWGLKEEAVTWLEVGIAFMVFAVSAGAIALTGVDPAVIIVPACIIDFWLLYKLDILNATAR